MHDQSLKELYKWGKQALKEVGIKSYEIDAQLLLSYSCNINKIDIFAHDDLCPPLENIEKYRDYIFKRQKFMPVQYILGKCEFFGLNFEVNQSTLIPRADTEILVEKAIFECEQHNFTNGLEIGIGSGCISIAMLKNLPRLNMQACDISKEALKIAKRNADNNKVLNRLNLAHSNLFDNIKGKFDFIISNPPYIPKNEILELDKNVLCYEPLSALSGGDDGLLFYRKISHLAGDYLNSNGGMIFFEIGYNQFKSISQILIKNGFCNIKVTKDLAEHDRVASAMLY